MPEPDVDQREGAAHDGGADQLNLVLVRGCGPLGREVATGLQTTGHRPVSIDTRTTAGPAESRRVDLRDITLLRRELMSLKRERGPAHAVVLLPRESPAATGGQRWEETADELLETTSIIRAVGPVLDDGGHVVLVTSGFQDQPSTVRRTTPAEAIVELAAAAVAEEVGVPLVRCLLDDSATSGGGLTQRLLDSIYLPPRWGAREMESYAAAR